MSSIETIWEMQDEINPHSYARVLDGVVNMLTISTLSYSLPQGLLVSSKSSVYTIHSYRYISKPANRLGYICKMSYE